MTANEEITISLPQEALAIARARVDSGQYASESEAIAEALLDSVLPTFDGPDQAFLEECAERYDRARKDPSSLLTLEQAFSGLID